MQALHSRYDTSKWIQHEAAEAVELSQVWNMISVMVQKNLSIFEAMTALVNSASGTELEIA